MAKEKEDEKDNKEEKKTARKEAKDADDEEGEGKEGGSKKKLIIIGAAAILLLAVGGAGLYFSGILGGEKSEDATEHAEGEGAAPAVDEHGKPLPVPGQPVFYDLPEFLVNLNTGGKQTSFLKMRVSLDLPSQEALKAVEMNVPRIQDDFNTYLRELRASDLSGSAGIYRLKEELLLRINKAIYPQKVNDILFKEILVQ